MLFRTKPKRYLRFRVFDGTIEEALILKESTSCFQISFKQSGEYVGSLWFDGKPQITWIEKNDSRIIGKDGDIICNYSNVLPLKRIS